MSYFDKHESFESVTVAVSECDVEAGKVYHAIRDLIHDPSFDYLEREEKVHGYLSKQFPTIANPAPLGLCSFALTCFILCMMYCGAAGGEHSLHINSSSISHNKL